MYENRIHNFSAGPAVLPLPVLKKAREEFLSLNGIGMSVLEISHRSREFEEILHKAEQNLRQLLSVNNDYAILFLQGGASLQFSMVPMNLHIPGKSVDLLQTGMWTQKAQKEIEKICPVRLAASTEKENFLRLPTKDEISLSKDAAFVYMCSNNTIFGTQWKWFPETGEIPLVADMSSDILSRKIDVQKFGLIFAGAQKNLGPAGVTVVIIRKDLAERADRNLPTMLQYRTHIKENSLYNTPPTFGIYMIALVTEWVQNLGGLEAIEKRNEEKAAILYREIDQNPLFYAPVKKEDRSLMNVVFRIKDNNEELEKKFVQEAEKAGLSGLKGHRSVGGLRASIYNACEKSSVEALVNFMQDFSRRYG
ncbi:MAG: 3-phosphoserine/phosphohydroxythreonine transaminase [Leptospiraceae bacterium]|nr:3-phosphoserine/phosphohydroxythreonine transaminase [Leptospiraceae bacterium]MDW8305786.1 3-phosphoserine/phosphohydroxythreonine transaminase [Leptospiraceae bacterium]